MFSGFLMAASHFVPHHNLQSRKLPMETYKWIWHFIFHLVRFFQLYFIVIQGLIKCQVSTTLWCFFWGGGGNFAEMWKINMKKRIFKSLISLVREKSLDLKRNLKIMLRHFPIGLVLVNYLVLISWTFKVCTSDLTVKNLQIFYKKIMKILAQVTNI